ncbi:MAG: SWIM zinc finger family protein [bacterium]
MPHEALPMSRDAARNPGTLTPPPPGPGLSLEQLPLFAGADRWVRRLRVASETEPGVVYTVAVDAAGRWGCSCPAWIYDPARPACKHIRAARERFPGGLP